MIENSEEILHYPSAGFELVWCGPVKDLAIVCMVFIPVLIDDVTFSIESTTIEINFKAEYPKSKVQQADVPSVLEKECPNCNFEKWFKQTEDNRNRWFLLSLFKNKRL